MKTAKQYKEERAESLADMEAMAETVKQEDRAFSQEELEKYDALEGRQRELEAHAQSIERIERLGSYVKQSQDRPIIHAETGKRITGRDVDLAFRAFALTNTEIGLSDDMHRAADKLDLNLNASKFTVKFEQTTDDDTQGGYLRNDSIYHGIETAQSAFGGVRSVANILSTGTGETIHIATVDDTANQAADHAEVATVANVDVGFGRVQLGAFSLATAVYPVSYELLQDSQFPLGNYLGERLGERIARRKNYLYTNGVGTTEPTGFLQDTVLGSYGVVDALIADDLYDLYFSCDQAYRNSPSCAWMMHDSTLANIVGIEDTTGRPLWGSGLNQAPGAMILGKKVVVNNALPEMEAGEENIVIAFGDWSRFYVREVGQVQIQRLNERYAQELSVGFIGWHRCDSRVIDAGQHPLVHLAANDAGSST